MIQEKYVRPASGMLPTGLCATLPASLTATGVSSDLQTHSGITNDENEHSTMVDKPSKGRHVLLSDLRSYDTVKTDLAQSLGERSFPDGFPTEGPWDSEEEAFDTISRFCKNSKTGDGAHGISKNCRRAFGSMARGPSVTYSCDRYRNPKAGVKTKHCGCKWAIVLEQTKIGWTVCRAKTLEHNHDLPKSAVEANANSANRHMPENIDGMAKFLNKARMKPAKIFRFLVQECNEQGIDVTFTLKDIQNKYCKQAGQKSFDTTNLCEKLEKKREEDPLLHFEISLNDEAEAERIYFVTKGAHEIWKRQRGAVCMYDTKHGTNTYGLKLGLITTVDEDGKTQALAASFVAKENQASFEWVFTRFSKTFSVAKIIFTDSDHAMAAALRSVWPSSVHLLCQFHLWKNFYEHIRNLIPDANNWKLVANGWWRLCKTTDQSFREEFDNHWDSLIVLIENSCADKAKFSKKKCGSMECLLKNCNGPRATHGRTQPMGYIQPQGRRQCTAQSNSFATRNLLLWKLCRIWNRWWIINETSVKEISQSKG